MSSPRELDDLLAAADRDLAARVERLVIDDGAWRGPSLLPGWSRAHAVAHVALNADALAGALEGVARDETVTMYPDDVSRDADIDELAAQPGAVVLDRLRTSADRFAEAARAHDPAHDARREA